MTSPKVEWSDYEYLLREIKILQQRLDKLENDKNDTLVMGKFSSPPVCDHEFIIDYSPFSQPVKKCRKCNHRSFLTIDCSKPTL